MTDVNRIDPDLLLWSAGLTAAQRLRQADAGFRLFHRLHRPFAEPYLRGFDSLEEFFRFQEEGHLPR